MNKPLVSVVIVTHNRLSEFKLALASVVNQNYDNLEIIIIDNMSNSSTKKFLKTIENITILSTNKFVNGNVARNKGIHAATGKYVAFLDDDDSWEPQKITYQVDMLEEHSGAGVCYTGMKKIYDYQYYIDNIPNSRYTGNVMEKIFEGIFTNTSTLMINRNVLFQNNIFFDEELTHWQEYDLLVRLSSITEFICLNDMLTIININSGSKERLSNQFDRWQIAVKYFYDKYNDRISKLDSSTKHKLRLNYVNDAISRLDNKKNVYFKRSKYVLERIYLTKSLRSVVYLLPGITVNKIRKISGQFKNI